MLEVGTAHYSRKFGSTRVTAQDILDVDPGNPQATIVGDLGAQETLPEDRFDCIILTQTLQYIFDLEAAVRQVRRALRPGGVLLMTVPGVAPVSTDAWQDQYYWRFTAVAVRRLLAAQFDAPLTTVVPFGNLYAATHFLHGAAAEESDRRKLEPSEPEYAVVIAARAVA